MKVAEKIGIYYAGLDNHSLPFGDGEKLISRTSSKQISYIKLLCLVSDEVIIPPSFYLYWAGSFRNSNQLSQLMDLYQAGFVSSSVHSTMSESKDFLMYKLIYGSSSDICNVISNKKILDELFTKIPLTKRDVTIQSCGFQEKIATEILNGYPESRYREVLLKKIASKTSVSGVVVSREELNILHHTAHNRGLINKHEMRQYYYSTNKCYYHQGALTYNSIISLVDAHKYSILGKNLFESKHGILLGYDPQVIGGILNCFGITDKIINSLSVQDIFKIKEAKAFSEFKVAYSEFARELQRIFVLVNGLSKEKILKFQISLREEFLSDYFCQKNEYEKSMEHWSFGEMTVFGLALGGVGFFVTPIIGAILGFLPILLWKTGLTPKLGGFIVNQIFESKTAFYQFITALRALSDEIEKREVLQQLSSP